MSLHVIAILLIAITIITHMSSHLSTCLCDPEAVTRTRTAMRSNGRNISGVTKIRRSATALKQCFDNKDAPQGRKASPPVVGAGSGMLTSADPASGGAQRQREGALVATNLDAQPVGLCPCRWSAALVTGSNPARIAQEP